LKPPYIFEILYFFKYKKEEKNLSQLYRDFHSPNDAQPISYSPTGLHPLPLDRFSPRGVLAGDPPHAGARPIPDASRRPTPPARPLYYRVLPPGAQVRDPRFTV